MNSNSSYTNFFERVNFLRNYNVGIKFLVAASMAFVLVIFLMYQVIKASLDTIEFSSKERLGTEYLLPLYNTIRYIQVHRGTTNAYLNGNAQARSKALAARPKVAAGFADIDKAISEYGDQMEIASKVENIKSDWQSLEQRAFNGPAGGVFKSHTEIVEDLQQTIIQVADLSNLTLDPELDSFYLMEIISFRLHKLIEAMGVARGKGAGVIASGDLQQSRVFPLALLLGQIDVKGLNSSLDSAYAANSSLRSKLNADDAIKAISGFERELNVLVNTQSTTLTSSEYFSLGTQAIDEMFDLAQVVNANLQSLLDQRVSNLRGNFWFVLAITLVFVAAVIFVMLVVITGIRMPLARCQDALASIGNGNLDNIIPISGDDEIGSIAKSIDDMQQLLKDRNQKMAEAAARMERITQALDAVTTNVMIADENYDIIYMNEAIGEMMGNAQADIRKDLPNFDTAKLLGSNIDVFHKNPAHQRHMLERLQGTHRAQINVGGRTFALVANPVIVEGERIGTVVEWDDQTERLARESEERRIANENARVKQALDAVSNNVMIANDQFDIIYMNEAIIEMMANAQADIRKDLPNFDTAKLIGSNIDVFHKNPSHQRHMLERLQGTHRAQINVGGRTFSLVANPVNVEGKRIGTVVEWNDRTNEVAIENEIDAVVDAAAAGDFSKQINMAGKEGFFANLSHGLNTLVSTVDVALNDVIRMLGAMAKGDLTERITRDYQGAFGQLKDDTNTTANKLTEVIGNIRSSAEAITSAANEIAQGNADLSQRTEEQASSLEETASSMEEMTSTVRQSSENAQQANQLSQSAQSKAVEGGDVVGRAVSAMDEINDSSKKISDIIGVIDEIAFQTNLLALNAAVEAARAGEQGRGFAVVAGEVRNLAQRSAAAAKEIKELIRDSVAKITDGSELVNESGATLKDIVSAVEQVSAMMKEISEAAQEQSSGIDQVNTAVSQMDDMTQQNAALVEEASAAGEAMAEQARSMSAMMDFFVVSGSMASDRSPATVIGSYVNTSPVTTGSSTGRRPEATDDEWEEF
ncbi:MAG: hypothetical protein AseanaTS_21120 [Candidatus Pelagadaptatus aseana]|uniref:methyl-accepting chemotaxis protein n=1 Tax=Candidatus Pelagadaptatus aseana TaxID=3120508 RepID=UPI0039B24914